MWCCDKLNQESMETEKKVAVVGDRSIDKTREIRKLSGCDSNKDGEIKGFREYPVSLLGGTKFCRVLDVSSDISTIKHPEKMLDDCDYVFGVLGSDPKVLNYWRELSKNTNAFFRLISLDNLEVELENL